MSDDRAYIFVVGNEKGGAGKTTTSMHLITSLMHMGYRVASIDLDSRQASLTRYIDLRKKEIERSGTPYPLSEHVLVKRSPFPILEEQQNDERAHFLEALNRFSSDYDFIVIDTPGSDTFLSRLAHSYADTIITPINDSFVDLDVLCHVSSDAFDVERPGIYSQMIWEQKINRAKRNRGEIDWVVMRNRLSSIDAINKRNVGKALDALSKRLGCRLAPGFGERVILKELFLRGLTLNDLIAYDTGVDLNLSHIAARTELTQFIEHLRITQLKPRSITPKAPSTAKAEMAAEMACA